MKNLCNHYHKPSY